MIFYAFRAANASGESNFKDTFTKNMSVFRLFTSNNATSLEEVQIGQHIMPFNIMLRFAAHCTIGYLLLGHGDLRTQQLIVIKLSRGRLDGLYIDLSSTLWKKTADRISVSFDIVGRTGTGMRQVVVFENQSTGRDTLDRIRITPF